MEFTYDSFGTLIKMLKAHGYTITDYHKWQNCERCAILRHDIDNDIEKALKLAKLEHELGVKSTYFVLVTSDFYNINSYRNQKMLEDILDYGHEIGLHFDEARYEKMNNSSICENIKQEAMLLSSVIGQDVSVVSMHRPSTNILEMDLEVPGIINSYGRTFFREFKYLSDSRRRWREPIDDIVKRGEYSRLHILTHAFWYAEEELDIHTTVRRYINHSNIERYEYMKDNISDIDTIMKKDEVLYE